VVLKHLLVQPRDGLHPLLLPDAALREVEVAAHADGVQRLPLLRRQPAQPVDLRRRLEREVPSYATVRNCAGLCVTAVKKLRIVKLRVWHGATENGP
jgi:hypothetical protein